MVYFLPAKINISNVDQLPGYKYSQGILGELHGIIQVKTRDYDCTYSNSHLLGAPREYVLHGLHSGLD
jgi:hypothetical protein